jgi:molybdopterin/thiamine biosynthesis adenylyltransferase/rhodanese-related sulfurtransferase
MSQLAFTVEESDRYSRHFVLPEVGVEGQGRLKGSRVLIVGVGGLGSPVALYLAAAGVGTIGIVDDDCVSLSNLQRQVLYNTVDVGRRKVDAARERLLSINHTINIVSYATRLDSSNALEVIDGYHIVADCTDNLPSRYLINDACCFSRKVNVYGSLFRFEGQVSVFDPSFGPCYRCLFPTPPPPELVQDCAQAGVLGVLPGIVGALQANEIIKVILRKGTALAGRLLMIDALTATTQEIIVRKDSKCSVCGESPTIRSLINYEEFCSGTSRSSAQAGDAEISDITVEELKRRLDNGETIYLLDVREEHEYRICNLGGQLIPLRELDERKSEIDAHGEVVVYCHHGIRSNAAVSILRRSGLRNVRNLVGGIDAWSRQVDRTMPRY